MSLQPAAAGVAEAEGHEHKTTLTRLIYMANQIGSFFRSQPAEKVVPGIVDHIQHFWDPRMRAAIFEHVGDGGDGLQPAVLEALTILKTAAESKIPTRGEVEMVVTQAPRTGSSAQGG